VLLGPTVPHRVKTFGRCKQLHSSRLQVFEKKRSLYNLLKQCAVNYVGNNSANLITKADKKANLKNYGFVTHKKR
jgi:hypothetical protein